VGQDSVALSVEPGALHALETGGIAEGQKVKVEGIVINRNDQSFTVRDEKGTETVVVVTDKTLIKKERKGWFHRGESSSADDIDCGLRLKIEGQGNRDGQLVAKKISIDEPYLKTAKNNQARFGVPLCNLCVSLWLMNSEQKQTTETPRTQRLHREECLRDW